MIRVGVFPASFDYLRETPSTASVVSYIKAFSSVAIQILKKFRKSPHSLEKNLSKNFSIIYLNKPKIYERLTPDLLLHFNLYFSYRNLTSFRSNHFLFPKFSIEFSYP